MGLQSTCAEVNSASSQAKRNHDQNCSELTAIWFYCTVYLVLFQFVVAWQGSGSNADDVDGVDDDEGIQQADEDSTKDSARWSSDVTWGVADFDLATHEWTDNFRSDETDDDDAQPFHCWLRMWCNIQDNVW